ncbi:hypothetical protein B23_1091 [Geobacillus thermoleovorans B23]|nr:hypothetical protein B23_1091 [Geobacillus thermoleovorans B23]
MACQGADLDKHNAFYYSGSTFNWQEKILFTPPFL